MSNRDGAFGIIDDEGLRVLDVARSGCGISNVPNRSVPLDLFYHLLAEDIGDEAHLSVGEHTVPISAGHTRALLAAMLEGMEAQIGNIGCFGVAEYPEYSAHFTYLPIVRSTG
jgi:hypothetical protein